MDEWQERNRKQERIRKVLYARIIRTQRAVKQELGFVEEDLLCPCCKRGLTDEGQRLHDEVRAEVKRRGDVEASVPGWPLDLDKETENRIVAEFGPK